MDPLYDLHSWSKHYREEVLREAQQRHLLQQERANGQLMAMRITFRLATAAALMVVIVALLLTLATAKPAEASLAGFPEGHGPIAFEKDGDIWVATKMHLANLTPNTADYSDADPVVSPDGRTIAFASDRDGEDFEIYAANMFTGEVERLTDNAVDNRDPFWSPDGQRISHYQSSHLSPTHSAIFSVKMTSI
jgi:hypothetical protein